MAEQAGLGFGGLLRRLRDDAGLTQDELAEAARVSQRAVSDLERGINRTARKDTALLLAGALGLDGPPRDLFVAAARGRGPVEAVLSARQGAVLRTFAAATGAERHNLPARLTSFVGREPELAALEKLLGGARLVTLTGAGGVGKTRLAVEFAAGATGRFRDGVWLADLVGITDPGLVPTVVMEALGARQDGDVPVIDALRWRLRSAQLLLVLDNCEHLLDACADLAGALLSGSAGLRVLATSRELLGVSGEVACPVQPLAVAAEEAGPTVIAGAPAVRLFLDRGSAVRAGAGLAGAPVAAVARICRELDGLPLAIELAAARTSVLSVEEIETHLSDKFAFLAYWRPVADPRHQALRTAIDWSYQLLTAAEQEAFRQLSVFAADFGLQQAAAVCCGGDLSGALDLVDRLAGKSLIVAETAEGRTRYRLLDTIRQYAAGRLADADEADPARRRHAEAYLALAERERGLDILAREHDNFRAALDWSLAHDSQAGPRLARALGRFWRDRGFLQEGQGWLQRAIAFGPADAEVGADLHRLLGAVLYQAGNLRQADLTLSEGSDAAASAGLREIHARIRVMLADIHVQLGRCGMAEGLAESEAAAAVLETEDDVESLAEAWLSIGQLRFFIGKGTASTEAIERARSYARQGASHYVQQQTARWLIVPFSELTIPADVAISRAEQLIAAADGDHWAEASLVSQLSVFYAFVGRFAEARAAIARSQSAFTGSGAKLSWAESLLHAGWIEMMAGDPAAAERVLTEGRQVLREMGERGYLTNLLATLAHAVYAQGRLDEAYRLSEEAEAITSAEDDIDGQVRWRIARAKALAGRGQFTAARKLVREATALAAPTDWAAMHAEVLTTQAEISKLEGAQEDAAGSLRQALRIYEERRASALADRTRTALASLSAGRR